MKDAYYFTHDSNARNDARVVSMMSIYGYEGYGRYWALVEFLREQDGYKFKISGKYGYSVLADLLRIDLEKTREFIVDCIEEFELFQQDNGLIWSESLLRRMQIKDAKSKQAQKSAQARWAKQTEEQEDAELTQTQSDRIAKKEKENKKKKKRLGPYLDMSLEFHQKQKKKGYQHLAFKKELDIDSKIVVNGADALDKIHRIEKESIKEITQLLTYITVSSFWRPNVISLYSLRNKDSDGNMKYFKIKNSMVRDQSKPRWKLSEYKKDTTGYPMGYCAKCGKKDTYTDQSIHQDSNCCKVQIVPKRP